MSVDIELERPAGFDFSNARRNEELVAKSSNKTTLSSYQPQFTSTGTTIVGCLFKGGVVLAADTRSTGGSLVGEKNCEKIHYIADNMWCCGAGTAADTEFTTNMISSNIKLHALDTGRTPRVVTAMTMFKQYLFRYQGHIGAYLILAGVDPTGAHLVEIHAHGSTMKVPYLTTGSGSLAAMSVVERRWKPDMTQEEATELVADAITAGIFNDMGSGSNVDTCVVLPDRHIFTRGYRKPNQRAQKEAVYTPQQGTTEVKRVDVWKHVVGEEVRQAPTTTTTGDGDGDEVMDVDR